MDTAHAEIARLLGRAKRRRRRVVLAAAAAGGLAAALAALLLGAAALALGARSGVARGVGVAGALGALAAAAAWAVAALRRGALTDVGAARAVAAGSPALRSDLVSAVELGRDREALAASGAISVELLDAHVARTAEATRGLDLAAAIPDRPARRAGIALTAVAGAHAVAFLIGGATLGRAWARVVAGEPAALAAPSLDPITGDVELTYRYPAHTRREPRTVSGTGGEIRAPKGTEVTLRTRADRPVEAAEVEVAAGAAGRAGPPASGPPGPGDAAGRAASRDPGRPESGDGPQRLALSISGGRDLTGALVVGDGGSYRFRFRTASGRTVAEGPPIPIAVEPDAFPTVRITAPAPELEVQPDATLRVEWQAEDDHGLGGLELVTRSPGGVERRRPVRALPGVRRDGGAFDLPLAAERLSEGERLAYWLEATDNDAVSGPKKGSSATQVVAIYSAAEHRRRALEKARQAWEALLAHLGDRLETLAAGSLATAVRLPLGVALDGRTRAVHAQLGEAAAAVRREKAAPPEVARGLVNVAAGVRMAEQRVTAARQGVQRLLAARQPVERGAAAQMEAFDRQLDRELEKGVLYLEQLFDKARAEDLVRMGRDLAAQRRELARLVERFRDAPSEEARLEVLAQLQRVRERMRELLGRMAEAARGFNDEHMNAEALAELGKEQDLMGELAAAEEALRRGDAAAAMKALDRLSGRMDQLMAGLERTARLPDERQRELMGKMLAFKRELEEVQAEQRGLAEQTARIEADLKRRLAPRLEQARQAAGQLERLAAEARQELKEAQPGVPRRAEPDHEAAQEAVADLQRALAMKDLEAATEMAQRASPPAQRLAMMMEEDAVMAERFPGATGKEAPAIREGQRHAREASRKLGQLGAQLGQLVPDGRQALTPGEQQRLSALGGRQAQLERRAAELQAGLDGLMQQAPVFPPAAPGMLGEARGHMNQAAGELGQRNAQRGHGQQEAALDALDRFRQGLEQVARQGGGPGGGFPFPFGEAGSQGHEGDGGEPAAEKVEIPGAEAHRVPEEFRRDLMEAMRQAAPERYRGEVQRYYEELVR